MTDSADDAIAIVGLGAILPDAPDAATFWANLVAGRSSITEVSRERWDPELYYDADRRAPDKTYSKIGGWVRDWDWSPLAWRLPVPPRTGAASPFRVNTQTRPWETVNGRARCAAVSAFGFGGTNFHVVLEEYLPGRG